ncbi:MAG: M48 family metalloprotease [Acidobacteriota bacterium]|nr:MAG: M48 family metalloprotease [Acidobacteriota bacterium]
MNKRSIAKLLIFSLIWAAGQPLMAGSAGQTDLRDLVNRSYLEVRDLSLTVKVSSSEIESFKKALEKEKDQEKRRLESEEKALKSRVDGLRKRLDALNKLASRDNDEMATERRNVHCEMLKLEQEMREKKTEREHGLPIAFENKLAKLDLVARWPAKKAEIDGIIESGRARERQYGDVEDIGVRVVGEGQEKDVKLGQDAINEMKAYGLMPHELEDQQVREYVNRLASTIAVNSDLKIPVKVTILESDEINAFALPGGYLFINTGIIEKADNESELIGVIAHELAHVSARHGARLMKRATIANIIFQAAQVAAMIFTGGLVGIGTYYALQYGFFGLGMVLDLALLGVSRDYEAEADQLGIQYVWRAGYDTRGFITFFDKMASEKGYVRSASFFRTHPPFFERILSSFSEIEYLPRQQDPQVDSSEFQRIREHVRKVREAGREEFGKRPTLKRLPPCDDTSNGSSRKPVVL